MKIPLFLLVSVYMKECPLTSEQILNIPGSVEI